MMLWAGFYRPRLWIVNILLLASIQLGCTTTVEYTVEPGELGKFSFENIEEQPVELKANCAVGEDDRGCTDFAITDDDRVKLFTVDEQRFTTTAFDFWIDDGLVSRTVAVDDIQTVELHQKKTHYGRTIAAIIGGGLIGYVGLMFWAAGSHW